MFYHNLTYFSRFQSGYVEGVEAGKDEGLQEGFSNGFVSGVRISSLWAVLRGTIRCVAKQTNTEEGGAPLPLYTHQMTPYVLTLLD